MGRTETIHQGTNNTKVEGKKRENREREDKGKTRKERLKERKSELETLKNT